ncbi:MAG: hypothetical protein M3R24_08965 [Chloroflexota bacterium]|nr:hypothetical protein [Chloroflexota bacterium]
MDNVIDCRPVVTGQVMTLRLIHAQFARSLRVTGGCVRASVAHVGELARRAISGLEAVSSLCRGMEDSPNQ